MTDEQLSNIEKRAQEAIPGPWTNMHTNYPDTETMRVTWRRDIDFGDRIKLDAETHLVDVKGSGANTMRFFWYKPHNVDEARVATARFIAHARQDVPALVAEVKRLRALLKAA